MATIPLKDITFPGLDNTYTIPEIDSTLSTAGKAADAKKTGDEIDQLKSEFTALESDGVVPSAEQILTDKGVTDSVPYHYRKTGGDGADRLYDQIVGGTVCWNQLVEYRTFSGNGITAELSGTTAIHVFGENTSGSTQWPQVTIAKSIIANHAYLVLVHVVGTLLGTQSVFCKNIFGTTDAGITITNGYGGVIVKSTASNSSMYIYKTMGANETIDATMSFIISDLTQMFGSTIADYIYSLETAHAGDGVAFFKALFPNDYYEYNSGELVSVSGLSAHVMRDVDDNIIRTYPLDSTLTLRGIPKLVDGKMCFDGDTYDADGTVTRKYGVVDLGTLTWNAVSGYQGIFQTTYNNAINVSNSIISNALCIKYITVKGNDIATADKTIAVGMNNAYQIFVHDSSYSSVSDFQSSMSGVYLVYELTTPTTEEADPYQHLQQCDPSGTEEYVSTGIVPVGHNSFYPENLRAKVEQLPWNFASLIAPTESTFTATRNYTTGALFIIDNVLYKATANIANGGTITPNTNCTVTTLAEIISALA